MRKNFLAILLFLVMFGFASFITIQGSIKKPDKDQGDRFGQVDQSLYLPGYQKTDLGYDPRFKMMSNQRLLTLPIPVLQTTGYVGYIQYATAFRLLCLRNGSIFVFNTTTTPGYNYSIIFWSQLGLDMTDFSLEAIRGSWEGTTLMYAVGKNTTDDSIYVKTFSINTTGVIPSIFYGYEVQVPSPTVHGTIISTRVYSASAYVVIGTTESVFVHGKYDNATDEIPFVYRLDGGFLPFVMNDYFDLNNATSTIYKDFDEIVLKVYYPGFHIFVTNKMVRLYSGTPGMGTFYSTGPLSVPLRYTASTSLDFSTNFQQGINVSKYFFTIASTEIGATIDVSMGIVTVDTGTTIISSSSKTAGCMKTEILSPDTIFTVSSDFDDGIWISGVDTRYKVWNSYVTATSDRGFFFDWYVPQDILVLSAGSYQFVEILYCRSNKVWISILTNDLASHYKIGNVQLSTILVTSADMKHSAGTRDFSITVSGQIQRNSSELVEFGMIPFSMGASLNTRLLFTTNLLYYLSSPYITKLTPIRNFVGTGDKVIDFSVQFQSELCPILAQQFMLQFVDMTMTFIVYERYANGSYRQGYIDGLRMKNFVVDWNYELQTSIQLADSHMLDELHVIADRVEYDPYSMYFLNYTSAILITDKVTNDTLFDRRILFQDPLVIPIPSKYEFFIRYFSNIDLFGFEFFWVNTFINNSEVTNEYVRILSPSAKITVKDFSDTVLKETVVSKPVDGSYVKIGLDIVQVLVKNNYNFSVTIFIERNGKAITFTIPSIADIMIRLGLGDYHYEVYDTKGKFLLQNDVTFSQTKNPGISFGGVPVQPIIIPGVDPILYVYVIGAVVVVIGISFYAAVRKRPTKSSGSRSQQLKDLFSYTEA